MQFTPQDLTTVVTLTVLAMGTLVGFFVLIAMRSFRANARRHLDLINAIVDTQDRERRRIAADMHDSLGQLIAAAKLQVDALRHVPANELADELNNIKETLDQASTEVRSVVNDLVPRRLERDGLWAAVSEMAGALHSPPTLSVTAESNATTIRLLPRAELALYRIVQELLTNAVRHAQPTRIDVRLAFTRETLRISFADNGRGFDADRDAPGNGLRNIRSRTAWLQGNVMQSTATPTGTRFEFEFDMKQLLQPA